MVQHDVAVTAPLPFVKKYRFCLPTNKFTSQAQPPDIALAISMTMFTLFCSGNNISAHTLTDLLPSKILTTEDHEYQQHETSFDSSKEQYHFAQHVL